MERMVQDDSILDTLLAVISYTLTIN